MNAQVQAHIVNRLHTMITSTMIGDLTFTDARLVDTNAVGFILAANAVIGLNDWDQPIAYPVNILVVPQPAPADE